MGLQRDLIIFLLKANIRPFLAKNQISRTRLSYSPKVGKHQERSQYVRKQRLLSIEVYTIRSHRPDLPLATHPFRQNNWHLKPRVHDLPDSVVNEGRAAYIRG
jgi:hypothetical protein